MKPKGFMQGRVRAIERHFGVALHDFERPGSGVLFSSGCGIGLALMDACPRLRFFVDVDSYRAQAIDWESLGVIVRAGEPEIVVLAGWFTIDRPVTFEKLKRGLGACVEYSGGGRVPLADLIREICVT